MDTPTTGCFPRRAVQYTVEQHPGFVPAPTAPGDYLDGACRRAGRVGVRLIATLACAATHRGPP
ncbi:hypothetical protein HAV22_00020 [Massilia sp. TW-1]|uniref:Uncharacterized protein n=1 Tax=Telluria antibiotica TaxID=2717319 RepID=A0ABX0P4B4_9BURK|nr:hypothetical protein [Telluria antibiotica]NIA52036.1 hypothetical protein [Telluria antibiotica]